MVKVKIFGAGSIGNHLAHACRNQNWDVLICDVDQKALDRTQNEIYPSRYGKWDTRIELALNNDAPREGFDLVIIGTPPESHIPLVFDTLETASPAAILIEKPLATPALEHCQKLYEISRESSTAFLVAYNHTLTANTVLADDLLKRKVIGKPLTIDARFREFWGGIFAAHPWLDGPRDSYLGYYAKGGGACFEHSHAINIWQHFAHSLDLGRVSEVAALLDLVQDGPVHYDRLCQLHVTTETGLKGVIIQDVVTQPAEKRVHIQGDQGAIDWVVNKDKSSDYVGYWDKTGKLEETSIVKTRPDDFKNEIEHIAQMIAKPELKAKSPIALERGLETMLVAAAAFRSHQTKRTVKIDYSRGWSADAFT